MQFIIADTFTGSLTKLKNHKQKAVKTTMFDLQVNPVCFPDRMDGSIHIKQSE